MPIGADGTPYTLGPNGQVIPMNPANPGSPLTQTTGPAAQAQPSGGNLPSFSASMTPDQVQAQVNQYLQQAGLPPDTGGYWAQQWQKFGQGDPNYFQTRLLNGMATSGGNMSQWGGLQSSTAPGGWGPGTSGFGGGSSDTGVSSPYGSNGFLGSPGYAYEQKAAQDAVQAGAAARGTLLTTGTQKDLQATAAGIAGQAFGLDSSNLLNLSQLGQNATNQAGSYITQQGNATAAGQAGSGSAWASGIKGLGNAALTGYAYNQTMPSTTGGYASTAANQTQNDIYQRNGIS